jgi:hypothetical protein
MYLFYSTLNGSNSELASLMDFSFLQMWHSFDSMLGRAPAWLQVARKTNSMEKRVMGIFLSLLGIVGLLYAGISFLTGGFDQKNIKVMIFSGVLGAIFFYGGISLIRNTKDRAT